MKTGRNLIIGAILSLSAASAIAPVVASAAPAITASAPAGQPQSFYHA